LEEQSGRKLVFTIPATRARNAQISTDEIVAEIRFASLHANVHNHFNSDRHLTDRQTYKGNRSAAMAEWQTLMA